MENSRVWTSTDPSMTRVGGGSPWEGGFHVAPRIPNSLTQWLDCTFCWQSLVFIHFFGTGKKNDIRNPSPPYPHTCPGGREGELSLAAGLCPVTSQTPSDFENLYSRATKRVLDIYCANVTLSGLGSTKK